MKTKLLRSAIPALLLSLSSTAAFSGMELQERTVPTPVGISTEFAQLFENRVTPPALPVPNNTAEWLALQAQFDAPGIKMAQQGLERLDVTYEVKQFAGVETFFVTPKNIAPEYKDKWLVHIHGGAFVFGGGESAL
ncbi:hypothetical protein [Aliivibrio fischeri]|nr:hypothetical protein [Aliivibrio fischeri]